MPFARPRNPNDPNQKKVSWLELFFDLIFALALAMAAKPLEHVGDFSWHSFQSLGIFILLFTFLIMFWYRHMVFVNRVEHDTFPFTVVTLFIGFLVIAFTQFIRIWDVNPELGSFLSAITIALATLSLAGIYLISTLRVGVGDSEGFVTWAKAYGKHMLWESGAYFAAIIALSLKVITPSFVPFWFLIVFIYFHRYPFEMWINPKKKSSLDPAIYTLPPEFPHHKVERIGLFSLLIYGLLIVLAATPLLEIGEITSVDDVLNPVLMFGKIFIFICVVWNIQFKIIEIGKPKSNQFVATNFINLGLLVAALHFYRIMLVDPNNYLFSSRIFSIIMTILLAITAVNYFNIKKMAALPPTDALLRAFTQWAYMLYFAAAAMFASMFFPQPINEIIWKITLLLVLLVMIFDKRLTLHYSASAESKKIIKYLDNQTLAALMFMIIGGIVFFVLTTLLGKSLASWWIIVWLVPLLVGFFMLLNQWFHMRIKPN